MSENLKSGAIALLLIAALGCTGASAPQPAAGDGGEIAARIGDGELTLAEVDARAKAADSKVYQALYDARAAMINRLVEERLLQFEADARGITRDALIQEVAGSAGAATDAEVQAFFDTNKANMRGQTLDQVRGQIETYVTNQKRVAAMAAKLKEIQQKVPVRVLIEPPRVEVTVAANDPIKGPPGAPIQILEFSDFQ